MISSFLLLLFTIKVQDKIERYIYAIASWMLICFSMTEILSVFNAINKTSLIIAWLAVDVLLIAFNWSEWRKIKWIQAKTYFVGIRRSRISYIWLAFAVFMLGLAIKTVPYNWDSMTYHLARLFHWAQNGSVDYYATGIDRQVASPVGAAYVNLHVYVLSGRKDYFVNLLQCCSFLTNGILVYYISKKIGCTKKYCRLAMLLFYTMPIAFGEALTTQVDNFSALWMLSVIYLLFDLLRKENKLLWNRNVLQKVIVLSLCVAFGYLTKPSIGIGLLFFAFWLLIVAINRKDSVKIIIGYLFVAVAIIGVFLIPGFYRNIATFGALSAPNVGARQLIGTLEPRYVLVNAVKNFTFNMPASWIYDSKKILYKGVMLFAEIINVEIDHPAIAEDGKAFLVHNPQTYVHDTAVNPVIIYLLIIFIVIYLVKIRKRHLSEMKNSYFVIGAISFIVFCAFLRWEPFVSRYMLSYLAVLCPALVGQMELFFEETSNKKVIESGKVFRTIVSFLCVVELGGLLIFHVTISRHSGYYFYDNSYEGYYNQISEYVDEHECKDVGIIMGGDSFEYPLTVVLGKNSHIEHVNVTNNTKIYEDDTFVPDAIISIESGVTNNAITCHGEDYELSQVIDDVVWVYRKAIE